MNESLLHRLRRAVYNLYFQLMNTQSIRQIVVDYDEYWQVKTSANMLGKANPFQAERAKFVADHIEDGESILDIGCGDGAVIFEIKNQRDVKVLGADVSDYALNFLKSRSVDVVKFDIENDDIATLPEADNILLLEVLEHMQNPEGFLESIKPLCRKRIFFSIPNTGFLPWRLRLLFGRFPIQWKVHPGEHLRFWTYSDLNWWLKELGYEGCFKIHGYEGMPILNKFWPSLFAQGLIVRLDLHKVS